MVYVGLDLHKRYITACAVTSDGRVVAEIRQLSTTWEALAAWLAALGAPLTGGNPWLKWILIEILQALKLAPGPVGAHYEKLLRAKGKPKATVAAARKFCTYLYWILKEDLTYGEWLRQHDRPEVRPMQPLGTAA